MNIKTLSLGPFQTNCYVVSEGLETLIIDPSAKGDLIAQSIEPDQHVLAILLTHGHFDHFGGAEFLSKQYNCPIYIHIDDAEMLEDPKKNYSMQRNLRLSDRVVTMDDGILRLGSFLVSVIHTPGHSEGSVCFHIHDVLFSGDLLFKTSIGRTDLYRGSQSKIMKSLQMILSLTDDLTILPGHGPKTSLGYERKYNPYL